MKMMVGIVVVVILVVVLVVVIVATAEMNERKGQMEVIAKSILEKT